MADIFFAIKGSIFAHFSWIFGFKDSTKRYGLGMFLCEFGRKICRFGRKSGQFGRKTYQKTYQKHTKRGEKHTKLALLVIIFVNML